MALTKYQEKNHRLDDIKHTGHQYEGTLFRENISQHLLNNDTIDEVVTDGDALLTEVSENIRELKVHHNIFMPRYWKRFS